MINRPIGVFDSGVGGISVLKELFELMPSEDFVYYGDSLNAPYGNKSLDEVRELTFKAVETLIEHDVKAIVIACNTATSAAVKLLREKYPALPIIGLEPALKPAITFKVNPVVYVLATPITLREEKFRKLSEDYSEFGVIVPVPCHNLAEIIEQGHTEGPVIENYLTELLKQYQEPEPDAVVLGCTHYPLAYHTIKKMFNPDVNFFDGGKGAARETKRRIEEKNALKHSGNGKIKYISSKDSTALELFAERFIK